ncbi:MAG TPA: ribonuclease P protein component [Saprospiraceae bacterium]|nr:ribonuclease P protein component [Saprospiraceae bacterium]
MRYTFGKAEKLKSRKLIEQLFMRGDRLTSFPIQLVYLKTQHNTDAAIQVGFSVPKRRFKRAVDRNRIKRLLRESYRLNKHELQIIQEADYTKKHIFMFVYIGKREMSFQEIESAMLKIFSQFNSNKK